MNSHTQSNGEEEGNNCTYNFTPSPWLRVLSCIDVLLCRRNMQCAMWIINGNMKEQDPSYSYDVFLVASTFYFVCSLLLECIKINEVFTFYGNWWSDCFNTHIRNVIFCTVCLSTCLPVEGPVTRSFFTIFQVEQEYKENTTTMKTSNTALRNGEGNVSGLTKSKQRYD